MIDMHAHFVPPALEAALSARAMPPRIAGGRLEFPGETLAYGAAYRDLPARLSLMEAQGVARQVLSLPPLFGVDSLPAGAAAPLTRAFNGGVAEICAAHPDRFAWLACLPLADRAAARAELDRALADPRCLGAILPGDCFATEAAGREMAPFLARLNAARGIAFLHPGAAPGQAPPAPDARDLRWARRQVDIQAAVAQTAITLLGSEVLKPFPGLTVQIANLAGCLPMVMERIDQVLATRAIEGAWRFPDCRLIADCASLGPRAIEIAVAMLGAERVVFGTDCPVFETAASREAIRAARLDAATRAAILTGNAEAAISAVR